MSMLAYFRLLEEARLDALLNNPKEIDAFLYPEEDIDVRRFRDPAVELCIDKAWHGLHFLLTGTPWGGDFPLNFIAVGGQPLPGEDDAYGPARGFAPEQVKQIAAALAPVPADVLQVRFSPAVMEENSVYPTGIWDDDGVADYLLFYYSKLKDFVHQAAEKGHAMLVYLS